MHCPYNPSSFHDAREGTLIEVRLLLTTIPEGLALISRGLGSACTAFPNNSMSLQGTHDGYSDLSVLATHQEQHDYSIVGYDTATGSLTRPVASLVRCAKKTARGGRNPCYYGIRRAVYGAVFKGAIYVTLFSAVLPRPPSTVLRPKSGPVLVWSDGRGRNHGFGLSTQHEGRL